jgi:DNA-binding response OmpR family regulator
VSSVLLMTDAVEPSDYILPALGLLSHQIRVIPAEASALLDLPSGDIILIDGRRDLPGARSLCRVLHATGSDVPVLLILAEGGLAAVTSDWGIDDIILESAGPGEVEARLRLAFGRLAGGEAGTEPEIRHGELLINESSYTATVRGKVLDLTYKEFELLKYLSQHPGRVFTRQQLLQEVWGYDYFGGTRTVDVHVRRLRAKLGSEYEALIGTVRNVGYRLVPPRADREPEPAP